MVDIRIATPTQKRSEEDVVSPNRRPRIQATTTLHVLENINSSGQFPSLGEEVNNGVEKRFVTDVRDGEELVHDVVHLLVHSGGAELLHGGVERASAVLEPRLLRGPVEELQADERVVLPSHDVGEVFGREPGQELRRCPLELGFVEARLGVGFPSLALSPSEGPRDWAG